MRKTRSLGLGLVFMMLVVLLCSANAAWAQYVTGSITGTVADQNGAVIAGATVTAKEVSRGAVSTSATNESGIYRFSQLPIGDYELQVEMQGFQIALIPAFTLVLNQTARVDVAMTVGPVTETVEVTGAAPLLKTETTQVDTIIDSATNDALPLATRNYVQLTLLVPGSITTNPAGFNRGDNVNYGGRPYINGNREQSNNFLLDGLDNNEVSDNLLGYIPSPDSIQEFNLISNNASAEFGNFQGGIVSVTLKSGTNSFRGDVWEYFRNDKLNASSWENKINPRAPPLGRSPVRWNMFGGTVGGPVIKKRLFFFADYQGQRFDHPRSSGFISVFTPTEQNGDFSQLLQARTPIQLYDPCAPGTGINGVACTAPAVRQPFPNNQIPLAMISPVARALFSSSFYPRTVSNALQNNAVNTSVSAFNSDQGDTKIDYRISDKDQLSGRFTRGFQNDPSTNSILLLGNNSVTAPIWSTVGDWTRFISTNLVNDLRFGWNHIILNSGVEFDSSVGAFGQQIGIAGSNPVGLNGLLLIGLGGGTPSTPGTGTLTNIGNSANTKKFNSQVWQFDDGLTYARGRHNFHFGGQYWRDIIKVFYSGNSGELGGMIFGPNFTTSAATNPLKNTGEGMADFFLGMPTNFGRGISSGGWQQTSNVFGGYIQDNWRITDRLTLNLGLRYEAHTPWVESNNHQLNFALFTGTPEYAGQNGNSAALYDGTYGGKDFQPRLGFAWTPAMLGGHTVLRGAFTISSYLEGTGTNLRLPQNPPFSAAEFLTQYNLVLLPGTTASNGIIAPPSTGTTCSNLSCFARVIIRIWEPHVQPAISDQWNLTIQRQVGGNTTFQLGYVGQRGTHLMVPMPYAQRQQEPTSASCPVAPCTAPSLFLAGNPALASEISQASGTASNGNMMYNAMQAVLQKQMKNGLQYQVAYSYSKCMTNNSGYYGSRGAQTTTASHYWQNVYNPKAEWAPCYYDATHVFSSYAIYELPIGHGKAYGKDMNKAINAVIYGWSVSAIVSIYTGFPLALYATSVDPTNTGSRGLRPNCDRRNTVYGRRDASASAGGGFIWFDPSNYTNPTTGFGTCAPALGGLRGPGYFNWDISLQKNFQMTERFKLQFRSDFLNAFNQVNLNAPNTNVGGSMGLVQSTQSPRNIQFALKLYY